MGADRRKRTGLSAAPGKPAAFFGGYAPMARAAFDASMKKPCPKAGPEVRGFILSKFPATKRAESLARKPPVITLLAKAANTDAGQREAKVGPAVSHLLNRNRARNCIAHIARLIGGTRLQYQCGFAGNQRSAE